MRTGVLFAAKFLSTPSFIQTGTMIRVAPIARRALKRPVKKAAIRKYQTF